MFQDIFPHRYNIAYMPLQATENDTILCIDKKNNILTRERSEQIEFPLCCELSGVDPQYLFTIDDQHFFLHQTEELPALQDCASRSIMSFLDGAPGHLAFAAATAIQISRWYRMHQCCGCCGQPLRHSETERAMICDNCHIVQYPRISPVVLVAVTNGDKLLLTRYANRPYKQYALVAGFCEVGETLEDTIRREVMEEVGLQVTNFRYYKSQPWSFSDSLLMGFYCSLAGDDEIHVDNLELAEAGWFDRDTLEPPSPISLTGEMIEQFRLGKEPK